jgi:predicted ribosomally synthesized peptide with SipW-like signal peptide
MNKKILISLSVIAAVAAIAIGGTIAYFSDTETSTGNTFTAGSLDLIVDIDGVDHNPLTGPIFTLADMKPGDTGEKTISLKVDNNPACGLVNINLTSDLDNTCTEPEIGDEPACATSPTGIEVGSGELNDQVQFIIFSDPDCDNKFETSGSETLTQGTLTGTATYQIGELPIAPAKQCYGIAYCFGAPTLTPNGEHNDITCDGSAINNSAQSDSFTADLVITAEQKRNQYPNGCPVDGGFIQMDKVNLENKQAGTWAIIPVDNIQGFIQYSVSDKTFHGFVTGTGLVANGKYQITLNGPGGCINPSDTGLAGMEPNAFSSGYWNNNTNLEPTCGTPGEGVYNMNLIGDHYTFIADGAGAFNYSFNLALPAGTYSGVKVLVKKMLDTHVSPWADTGAGYPMFNLYEVAPISFTIIP